MKSVPMIGAVPPSGHRQERQRCSSDEVLSVMHQTWHIDSLMYCYRLFFDEFRQQLDNNMVNVSQRMLQVPYTNLRYHCIVDYTDITHRHPGRCSYWMHACSQRLSECNSLPLWWHKTK